MGVGDGTYILRYRGMCCSGGSLFHKKSTIHGSHFLHNYSKHGSVFPEFQKTFWCLQGNSEKMGLYFEKNLYKLVPFPVKMTLKNGRGFSGFAFHNPPPNQIWVPLPGITWQLKQTLLSMVNTAMYTLPCVKSTVYSKVKALVQKVLSKCLLFLPPRCTYLKGCQHVWCSGIYSFMIVQRLVAGVFCLLV